MRRCFPILVVAFPLCCITNWAAYAVEGLPLPKDCEYAARAESPTGAYIAFTRVCGLSTGAASAAMGEVRVMYRPQLFGLALSTLVHLYEPHRDTRVSWVDDVTFQVEYNYGSYTTADHGIVFTERWLGSPPWRIQ